MMSYQRALFCIFIAVKIPIFMDARIVKPPNSPFGDDYKQIIFKNPLIEHDENTEKVT